jgi:hypothetical protein
MYCSKITHNNLKAKVQKVRIIKTDSGAINDENGEVFAIRKFFLKSRVGWHRDPYLGSIGCICL